MTCTNEAEAHLPPGILDNFQLEHTFRIDMRAGGLFGDLFSVRWDDIRHLAIAAASLSAEVTKRSPSEFELSPYLLAKAGGAIAGIYITHKGRTPLSADELLVRSESIATFMHTISGGRSLSSGDLPFSDAISSDQQEKIDEASRTFLDKRTGSPKLSVPIIASLSKQNELIRLSRMAPKMVDASTGENMIVAGLVEGLDRDARTIKILTEDRKRISVHFSVEAHLDVLKTLLCDNFIHRLMIATVRDAKGRAGEIVSEILKDEPVQPMELKPSASARSQRN